VAKKSGALVDGKSPRRRSAGTKVLEAWLSSRKALAVQAEAAAMTAKEKIRSQGPFLLLLTAFERFDSSSPAPHCVRAMQRSSSGQSAANVTVQAGSIQLSGANPSLEDVPSTLHTNVCPIPVGDVSLHAPHAILAEIYCRFVGNGRSLGAVHGSPLRVCLTH
jgi:hypothetical protein